MSITYYSLANIFLQHQPASFARSRPSSRH